MSLQNLLANSNQYYGNKYKYLNNIKYSSYNDNVLFKFQLQKIKQLELISPQLAQANALINSVEETKIQVNNDKIEELSINQIAARIMEILNSAFWGNEAGIKKQYLQKAEHKRGWTYKPGENKETLAQGVNQAIQELTTLLEIIKYPKNASNKLIAGFKKGINSKKINGQTYAQFKADQAEELMMHLISQNSGFNSIVTGKFYNKAQQLLQDGFAFDINQEIKFDQGLSFTIHNKNSGKDKNIKANSLNELFNEIAKINGNYSIHLSNELYDILNELSVLRAQAKSGYGVQELINSTKNRGAIALNQTDMHQALIDLYDLYTLGAINDKKDSKTLEALANYSLSKSIQKTTLMGNDIYFTKDGFITASKWMETYKYMLAFNPGLTRLSSDFLTKTNPYILRPVK